MNKLTFWSSKQFSCRATGIAMVVPESVDARGKKESEMVSNLNGTWDVGGGQAC